MHILEKSIRAANTAGRAALIPFLTAGFPTMPRFWECLNALDTGGADIIEIGVPFSDPVADGVVVAEASRRALENGVSLGWILENLAERQAGGHPLNTPLVLMSYYNPLLQYGLEKLATDCKAAGIHGCIVPDLPLEEADTLRALLDDSQIALIPLVAANTPPERLRAYARISQGYVYVVSVLGTTGGRVTLSTQAADAVCKARNAFTLPIALGFGLQHPAQLDNLPAMAQPDALIFGSALLRHIDEGHDAAAFLQLWQ